MDQQIIWMGWINRLYFDFFEFFLRNSTRFIDSRHHLHSFCVAQNNSTQNSDVRFFSETPCLRCFTFKKQSFNRFCKQNQHFPVTVTQLKLVAVAHQVSKPRRHSRCVQFLITIHQPQIGSRFLHLFLITFLPPNMPQGFHMGFPAIFFRQIHHPQDSPR